jgi:hypothetical protein
MVSIISASPQNPVEVFNILKYLFFQPSITLSRKASDMPMGKLGVDSTNHI